MPIVDEVRSFIHTSFFAADGLGDGDSLIDTGTIDSTGVQELIAFAEERFAIVVADHEIVADNFDSVNRLTAYIDRKLAGDTTLVDARDTLPAGAPELA